MTVQRYNYPAQFGPDVDRLLDQLREMILHGPYVLGPEVLEFESRFAQFLSVTHVRGVNSGTDALILALMALGVGPGDEVITHANTFHATVAAIRHVGARPVLVDADDDSCLMDLDAAADAITDRTKVLLPVHLFGKPTPMKPLMALAEKHGLLVVEDAAQAVGARYDEIRAGTSGHAGCFSFHPSKNLAAAGDGGAIATNDATLAEALRLRRELGQERQNHHVVVGLNSKLDALQAKILTWKLASVDCWTLCRQRVAGEYRSRLADLPVRFQSVDPREEHAYHLFQLRTDRRDALLEHLQAAGIDAVIRYPVPIHLQPAFHDDGWHLGQFPVAERTARESLCLPIRPDMGETEIAEVVMQVRRFFRG